MRGCLIYSSSINAGTEANIRFERRDYYGRGVIAQQSFWVDQICFIRK